MLRKKLAVLTTIVTLATIVLAACGPAPTPEVVEKVVKETVVVEKEVEKEVQVEVIKEVVKEVVVTATPAPAPVPAPKGVLRWAWDEYVDTLHPYGHLDIIAFSVLCNVYEPLVMLDADGELQPVLATSWEVIDDTTWEFKLREGVEFHNGEPFTAEAVKASLEAVVNPPTQYASNQAWLWAPIYDHTEIVDDYTVRIHTTEPFGALLRTLTLLHIAPPKAIQAPDYGETMAWGTGPFKVVKYDRMEGLVAEANMDYWGGPPKLAGFEFYPIIESATRVAALRAGDVDLIISLPIEEVISLEGEGLIVLSTESNDTLNICVGRGPAKQDVWPWNDPKFVEAVTYAIDRPTLVGTIFMGQQAAIATSVLSPGIFGYCKQPPLPYDPEKAREMLAELDLPEDLEANIVVPQGVRAKSDEAAMAIAEMLAEVGLPTKVTLMEPSSAWPVLNSSDFDFFFDGWGTMTMDADMNMYKNWHVANNREGTDIPEVTALLEKGRTAFDSKEREEAYCKAQELIWNGVSRRIPLYHLVDIYGVSSKVRGWRPRHDKYMPLKDVWLEE